MTDFMTRLGLRTPSITETVPNYAGHFLIANFLLTYVVGSTRFQKVALGLDNNISPRGDLDSVGDAAVKSGKITREQLDKLKRVQAAHENGMEHFPVFVGAVCLATMAGLNNSMINRYSLVYTVVRLGYSWVYANNTTVPMSYVRSLAWWASNITCIRLYWFATKALNAGKAL